MQLGRAIEIDQDLYNKLLKSAIIRANPKVRILYDKKKVVLDPDTQAIFENGIALGKYLVTLKDIMKKNNQELNIDPVKMTSLKNQITPQARLFNWGVICTELDKLGVTIESDNKSLAVAGDQDQINTIFMRVERFLTKIAGKSILNFENFSSQNKDPPLTIGNIDSALGGSSNARRGNKPNQKKVIKDGVDILTMNAEREISETESTLELILNTLCKAFQMKPKQAAALLTNNNQFLIHSIVKGVKGKYEPLLGWYQDLYAQSRHLTMLLELEQEQFPQAQNFKKVLATLSCGLYSHNIEICKWCSKLLTKVGYDFGSNQILFDLSMEWFLEKEGGLELSLHALKKHSDLAEDFVSFVSQFSSVNEKVDQVYKVEFKKFFSSPLDYVNAINDLIPFLTAQCNQEIRRSGILDFWIESCVRQADNDGKHSFDERISALTLLTELWMSYPDYIDEKEEVQNSVLQMLKRGARDRHKPIRTVAICELFRLLDKFSEEKNQAAPSIYKTLIFSLVENPQDTSIRDLYFSNFTQLYHQQPSIPVGLLIEPLIKQIQVSEGVAYFFEIFDFDFFAELSKHTKLKLEHAIPLIDLLAKIYLNDVSYASAACIPFMNICQKFINEEALQEFIIKFITICLSMLMGLEKNAEELQLKQAQLMAAKEGVGKGSKKILALPAPPMPIKRGSPQKKLTKEDRAKKAKQDEEEVIRRLKKTHIVELIIKIQNLKTEEINDQLRDMLLSTQKRFSELYGFFNKGIQALLKWWGDPEQVMISYIRAIEDKEQREREEKERKEREEKERLKREQEEKERIEKEEKERRQLEIQEKLKQLASEGGDLSQIEEEERRLLALTGVDGSAMYSKDGSMRGSMALLPYTGIGHKTNMSNVRAIKEIEKIKQSKNQIEEQKRLDEERKRLDQEKKKKNLKEQLEKRKIELGVSAGMGGRTTQDEIKALIYKEGTSDKDKAILAKILLPQLKLVDLDEEEERDKEAVVLYMKKYGKLWKNLFSKYANACFSSKQITNFDQLNDKYNTMNMAEMTRILRDHGIMPQLISKDELAQLFRLINIKLTNSSDLQALEYNSYVNFMMQLGFLCFSRPPKDLSHLPPVEQLRGMVQYFEAETKTRGNSTVLYEDPDATDPKDRPLIRALNEKLANDQSYPVPEGFYKVVERTPVYDYRIPDQAADFIGESSVVVVETIDNWLNDLFGFHFLEPLISYEEKLKVKKSITNQFKPQGAESLNYMKKVEKKLKPIEDRVTSMGLMSAQQKRQLALEIKPQLNVELRLEVAKYPLKDRPHAQEVAETLEEMLQAVDKGLDYLPPRPNRAPGQIYNEAKKIKYDDIQKEEETKKVKEDKRVKRDTMVKSELLKIKDEKDKVYEEQKKTKEDREQKEREDKKKKWLEQKRAIDSKRRQMEDQKNVNYEELSKKKQEEDDRRKQDEELKKKQRVDFMKKQKQKIQEDFDYIKKEREDLANAQEQVKKQQIEYDHKIRSEMESFIKENVLDRDKEKDERRAINEFLHQHDVENVFAQYDKSLYYMYKFYASQEKKDVGFSLEKSMNTLNFREFVRFGFQQNIVPALMQPDDMVQIFRQIMRDVIEERKIGQLDEEYINDKNYEQVMDYEFFKKAIIRIAIVAQNLLGGQKEDLLIGKLEEETQKKADEQRKREKQRQSEQDKKQAEREAKEELRRQFIEEQKKLSKFQDRSPKKPIVARKKASTSGKNDLEQIEDVGDYNNENGQNDQNNLGDEGEAAIAGTDGEDIAGKSGSKKKLGKKGKVSEEEQLEINIIKKQNEDAFFTKWIKQREAAGISLKKRIIGKDKEGTKVVKKKKKKTVKKGKADEGEDEEGVEGTQGKKTQGTEGKAGRDSTLGANQDDLRSSQAQQKLAQQKAFAQKKKSINEVNNIREGEDVEEDEEELQPQKQKQLGYSGMNLYGIFASPAGNRKTKAKKDLLELQEKAKFNESIGSTKIENKKIKKGYDIQIVTAKTIEALMLFLGIKPDDNRYILDRKLNNVRIEIQGQKPVRIKKQLKPNKLEAIRESFGNLEIEENQEQQQQDMEGVEEGGGEQQQDEQNLDQEQIDGNNPAEEEEGEFQQNE